MKVVVTGGSNTVYQKAHQESEVALTERVQKLIDSGKLVLVSAHNVPAEDGTPVVNANTKAGLTEKAEALGITVDSTWTKPKIQEVIDRVESGGSVEDPVEVEEPEEPEEELPVPVPEDDQG